MEHSAREENAIEMEGFAGEITSKIWFLGDSEPDKEEVRKNIKFPLDPRHPTWHMIWISIEHYIQEYCFIYGENRYKRPRRLKILSIENFEDKKYNDTYNIYIRNAVQDSKCKPVKDKEDWYGEPPNTEEKIKLKKSYSDFKKIVERYRPTIIITFGQFSYEFSQRVVAEIQGTERDEKKVKHWTEEVLGREFLSALEEYDAGRINMIPLLHNSVSKKFWEAHKRFAEGPDSDSDTKNYFKFAGHNLGKFFLDKFGDNNDFWFS